MWLEHLYQFSQFFLIFYLFIDPSTYPHISCPWTKFWNWISHKILFQNSEIGFPMIFFFFPLNYSDNDSVLSMITEKLNSQRNRIKQFFKQKNSRKGTGAGWPCLGRLTPSNPKNYSFWWWKELLGYVGRCVIYLLAGNHLDQIPISRHTQLW